jgi:hypothetical protein
MKLSTAKNYFEDFHKDGEADKFIDLFPVDKYRTDNVSIPLFKFDYSAYPVQSSHISYFDKNMKNPKANELPLQERVPLTHYKTDEIKQPHVEDIFENNIIQNQKNVKFPRKELPEKYAYGLDHKGLGDIAYERLDIENGDTNELSRNLENFYEDQYLKQVEPQKMRKLEGINKSIRKHANNPNKQEKIGRANALKQEIEVEIPEILGKVPKYHSEESIYQKYRPLQNKADRILSQKKLYEINNILISHGEKPLPVGTRSKAAARKLNKMEELDLEYKNEGEKLKFQSVVAKAQKLGRNKLSKKQRSEVRQNFESAASSGGFEEGKMEHGDKEVMEEKKLNNTAASKIQSKYRQNKAMKAQKLAKSDEQRGFEEMARKKGETQLSLKSVSGGDAESPKSPVKTPQENLNLFIVFKRGGKDDKSRRYGPPLQHFTEEELSQMIDQSPHKVTKKQKEDIIKDIKNPEQPTPSKTPSTTKMGKKEQERQAAEMYSGIPIILSDFEKNIKQVEEIYDIVDKSPGADKITAEQIRTINKFMPPNRKVTAGAGRVRVGQALKELEELYIEESRLQKIQQLPGESANIVTPMQKTPPSKKSSV